MSASLSASLSAAPLSDAEKADVRRFCGYPEYGSGFGSNAGYRYFQQYGYLEYRMNDMRPEEYQVTRLYLSNLYLLEAAIPAASATLDIDTAAVYIRNKNELKDRLRLYRNQRLELARFIGVDYGSGLSGSDGSIQLVV